MKGEEERIFFHTWLSTRRGVIWIPIWGIHPGYLTRSELLTEHQQLHAAGEEGAEEGRVLAGDKASPAWIYWRHRLVVAELTLRGQSHSTPLSAPAQEDEGVESVTAGLNQQFGLLAGRREPDQRGRIPLPARGYDFWAHHKYSVMARGYNRYRHVAQRSQSLGRPEIGEAGEMVELVYGYLHRRPEITAIRNTWQHVIGYFKGKLSSEVRRGWLQLLPEETDELRLIVYQRALEFALEYIVNSTLLADPDSFSKIR